MCIKYDANLDTHENTWQIKTDTMVNTIDATMFFLLKSIKFVPQTKKNIASKQNLSNDGKYYIRCDAFQYIKSQPNGWKMNKIFWQGKTLYTDRRYHKYSYNIFIKRATHQLHICTNSIANSWICNTIIQCAKDFHRLHGKKIHEKNLFLFTLAMRYFRVTDLLHYLYQIEISIPGNQQLWSSNSHGITVWTSRTKTVDVVGYEIMWSNMSCVACRNDSLTSNTLAFKMNDSISFSPWNWQQRNVHTSFRIEMFSVSSVIRLLLPVQ